MSNYGAKISLPGSNFDAGLKKLILHSSFPLLKIHSSGGGTLTYTAGTSVDILVSTHSLGYKPLFFFYSQYFDDFLDVFVFNFTFMPFVNSSSSFLIFNDYQPYVTTTELRYAIGTGGAGNGGTDDISYYWFIFHDEE